VRWKRLWIAFGIAALAVSAAHAAPDVEEGGPSCRAEDGPGGHGRHGGHGPGIERVLERNADRLGLDDATRARIRALAEQGREQRASERDAVHRLHDEMRALLTSDAPDADAVMAKADAIGAAETALQKQRLRTMLAIRALLTSEQRRELVKIHEEFRARRAAEGGEHGPACWRDRGERE
jgi:Spy/CpxP family protein refolding chaperone